MAPGRVPQYGGPVARRDEVDRTRGRVDARERPCIGAPSRPALASDVEVEDIREAEEIVGEHLARLDWTRVSLRACRVHLVDVAELVLDRARLIDSPAQRVGHHGRERR